MNPLILVLAVLPAAFLIVYIYRMDKHEKEPFGLLASLFVLGALTTFSSMAIELLYDTFASAILPKGSLPYKLIENFLIISATEETGKYVVLRLRTWKSPEFNYTFDGVVYAVVVSLGFAVVENIIYVILHGSDVNLVRVLLSVPGHMVYAVFMGFFYGQARYAKGDGDSRASIGHTLAAIMVPTVMHGFYSFCIGTGSKVFFIMFIVYEVIMALIAVLQFIRLSKNDTLIPGMEYTVKGEDK